MNERPKKLWLAALRSGLYKQGRYYMRSYSVSDSYGNPEPREYCCLGVLQVVARQEGLGFTPRWGETKYPPEEVLEWAGLSTGSCYLYADMNDEGRSFAAIADVVEKAE